jgi:hypothetical protein
MPHLETHVQWIVEFFGSHSSGFALHSDAVWAIGKPSLNDEDSGSCSSGSSFDVGVTTVTSMAVIPASRLRTTIVLEKMSPSDYNCYKNLVLNTKLFCLL